jgi:GT2 family glycosyltransferase
VADVETPRVHVVILNWNGWEDTVACVASVKQTEYPDFHIVVVDNASSDGSEERIRAAHPDITVLQSGGNLGYAGGNNVGIRHALDQGADFVWILNNDTSVAPDALAELVRPAADPQIGIVGSKIYFMAAPTRLWFAGGRVDWRRGIAYHLGDGEDDTGQYDAMTNSDTAQGASMLVSRATFEQIGLMDERYFLYFEEADFCCRARDAGFRVAFAPASHVWHSISKSTGARSSLFLYYFTRNNILFVRRHRKMRGVVRSAPYLLKRSLKDVSVDEKRLRLHPRRLRIWMSAWLDGLRGRGGPKQGLATA